MIVYVSEDFLRRNYELCHFPHCLQGRLASHGSVFMARGVLTVSKSIDVNLKRRRKKGGTLMEFRRWVEAIGPDLASVCYRDDSVLAAAMSRTFPFPRANGKTGYIVSAWAR